jgi:hypothetical protein
VNIYHEADLLEYSKCPLRVAGLPANSGRYVPDILMSVAIETMKDVFMTSFKGREPGLKEIREVFDSHYKSHTHPSGDEKKTKHSLEAAKASIRVCKRIREILDNTIVVEPFSIYRVFYEKKDCIEGEFATLYRKSDSSTALAFYPGLNVKPFEGPDVVSYARWLQLTLNNSEFRNAAVYRTSLSGRVSFMQNFNQKQVTKALSALVNGFVNNPGYPTPGAHCNDCITYACRVTGA